MGRNDEAVKILRKLLRDEPDFPQATRPRRYCRSSADKLDPPAGPAAACRGACRGAGTTCPSRRHQGSCSSASVPTSSFAVQGAAKQPAPSANLAAPNAASCT